MLVQYCDHAKQGRNHVATLCWAKNRRCQSSRITLSLLFLNLDILKNSTPREFALHNTSEVHRSQVHFSSDVFVAVPDTAVVS